MASNTPYLNLRKPDGVDLVNYLADLDDNYDKIDAGVLAIAKLHRCRVSRITAQAVGSGVSSAVVWTVEDYDSSTMWNPANPSRIVAPVAGTYNFSFGTQFAISAAGGARSIFFLKNSGGAVLAISHFFPNASWYAGGVVETDVVMAANDFIECMVYQNSGGVLNLDAAYAMWATGKLVALP